MHQPEDRAKAREIESALREIGQSAAGKTLLEWLRESQRECFDAAMNHAVLNPQIALAAMTDAAKLREVVKAFEEALKG